MTVARSFDDARSVPVCNVRSVADPYTVWPWCSPPVDDWGSVWRQAEPVPEPVGDDGWTLDHVGRVRWLIENGWVDPIHVDVGCFDHDDWWPIEDGNHRLVAATIRADPTILVVVSGDLDDANRILKPSVAW